MNRATLLGRAGRNPNVRDLKNCDKAAVFTLAISGIGRCYSREPTCASSIRRR